MKSNYMKACLSNYFRFAKGVHMIATEVGRYNSDFLAVHDNKMIEVEIKTSKTDFNNDFKKRKHAIYSTARCDWTPTMFYFAVPEHLLEHAMAVCADKKYGVLLIKDEGARLKSSRSYSVSPKAGSMYSLEGTKKRIISQFDNVVFLESEENSWGRLIHFEHDGNLEWQRRVKVVKRAKKLSSRLVHNKVKQAIVARLSSEMANLRVQVEQSNKIDTK